MSRSWEILFLPISTGRLQGEQCESGGGGVLLSGLYVFFNRGDDFKDGSARVNSVFLPVVKVEWLDAHREVVTHSAGRHHLQNVVGGLRDVGGDRDAVF